MAYQVKVKSLGVIGLGRMGIQIARRLYKKGFNVIAWNRSPRPRQKLQNFFRRVSLSPPSSPPISGERNRRRGGESMITGTIPELVKLLKRPRIVWLMLPASETDKFIQELSLSLSKGDIIIDGSNSFYRDSLQRANKLARYKIHYLDAGVSGGVWGEKNGFSIMVGGNVAVFKKVEPIFRALAARPDRSVGESNNSSYGLVGKNGTGHFVKMVHNGIEYGMMEAIAEGFAVLEKSQFNLNLAQVARIWHKGAVVSSWLVDLARDIFEKEDLRKIVGYIHHTGEGEWTIKEAKRLGINVRVIKDAFKVRLESSQKKNRNKFSNKVVALLRNRFGGHDVAREN